MNRAYRAETRKYKVGCGELNIRLQFKGDESFHFSLLSLDNKGNECGCCLLEVLANFITATIRRIDIKELPSIIKNLKGQRCKQDYGLQNCPNKIYEAITEAFKEEDKK